MKLLIIGSARHGKDTTAEMFEEIYGLSFSSSSLAASEIFLFDAMRMKYGYNSAVECFEDRVNRRSEWYNLICLYNRDDKAKLAKKILDKVDIYVGMRDDKEEDECRRQGLFDYVIGVFDPRKPLEPADSFKINFWEKSDFIISNAGTKDELRKKVAKLAPLLSQHLLTKKAA